MHATQERGGDNDVDDGRSATIGLRHEQATLWSCNDDELRDHFSIAYWPPEGM